MNNGFLRKNFLIIFGAALLIFGIYAINRVVTDNKLCTEEVTGVVSEYKVEERTVDGKRRTYYYPIFTYKVDGKTYTQKYSYGGSADYEIGQEVLLKYEPAYPQNFIIAEKSPMLVMGIINGGLGLIFIVYEAMIRLKAKKRESEMWQ